MTRLTLIIILVAGVLLGAGHIFSTRSHKLELRNLQEQLLIGKQNTEFYRDKYNRSIAETVEITLDKANLQLVIDSLKIENNRIRKNVKTVTQLQFIVKDSIVANLDTIVVSDSSRAIYWTYENEFMKINNGVAYSGADTSYVSLTYNYLAEVNLVHFTDKKFFKPNVTKVMAILEDPNAAVTGLNELILREPNRRWSVGITIGYGFNQSGVSPFVGVGITRKIFSF